MSGILVERIARAMAVRQWSPLEPPEGAWRDNVRDARAALEAIQQPTPRMLDAGVAMALNVTIAGAGSWTAYIDGLWKTMITAALTDEAKG